MVDADVASPRGGVLTFDTKGAIATYWRPGWPLRGWMDWAGRRLCRPPAGHGNGRAPAGALGKGGWGAFEESAEEGADREDSFPTGRWRPGWAAKVGGAGSGDPAYRVAAQVAAAFRGWLGILRGWESGSRGDGAL